MALILQEILWLCPQFEGIRSRGRVVAGDIEKEEAIGPSMKEADHGRDEGEFDDGDNHEDRNRNEERREGLETREAVRERHVCW